MELPTKKGTKKRANGTGRMVIECQQCGVLFSAYKCHVERGTKYCSKICFWDAKRKPEQRTCPICNKQWMTTPSDPSIHCSHTCGTKAQRTRIKRFCEVCGKPFYISPSYAATHLGRCCSQECAAFRKKSKRAFLTCRNCGMFFERPPSQAETQFCSNDCKYKLMRGEEHPLYNKVEVSCSVCGKAKTTNRYRLKKQQHFVCSNECQKVLLTKLFKGENGLAYTRVVRHCLNCNIEMKLKLSHSERRKTCSKKCLAEWAVKEGLHANENNAAWKGGISKEDYCPIWTVREGQELKNIARDRDGHRCQALFCSGKTDKLLVHHIDWDKKNCDLDNLVTLCNSCHTKLHWKHFVPFQVGSSKYVTF